MFTDYFDGMKEGIEFIIAFASIMGLLGFLLGIFFIIFGGSKIRGYMIWVVIISIILLAFCGPTTGIKYFRIY